MTARRSTLEVRMDVLQAINENGIKTRVMYAANISWLPMMSIIKEMLNEGLVIEEKGIDKRSPTTWKVTKAGDNKLKMWREFKRGN